LAVHLAAGDGGLPGLFRDRRSVTSERAHLAPMAEGRVDPVAPEAPSATPAGEARTWTGTMTGEGAELVFALVLRADERGRATAPCAEVPRRVLLPPARVAIPSARFAAVVAEPSFAPRAART